VVRSEVFGLCSDFRVVALAASKPKRPPESPNKVRTTPNAPNIHLLDHPPPGPIRTGHQLCTLCYAHKQGAHIKTGHGSSRVPWLIQQRKGPRVVPHPFSSKNKVEGLPRGAPGAPPDSPGPSETPKTSMAPNPINS
jgi:hypothetical protein